MCVVCGVEGYEALSCSVYSPGVLQNKRGVLNALMFCSHVLLTCSVYARRTGEQDSLMFCVPVLVLSWRSVPVLVLFAHRLF